MNSAFIYQSPQCSIGHPMEIFSFKQNFQLSAIKHLGRMVFKIRKQSSAGSVLLCVLDFSQELHVSRV